MRYGDVKMNTKKKDWKKPLLIILERVTSEESVLAGCKLLGDKSGPSKNNCKASTGSGDCSNITSS